MTEVEGTLGDP